MKNILVVDDHSVVRFGTTQIINQVFPLATITEAANMDQMLICLRNVEFDFMILDINIPGGNSFQMIDLIRLRQPSVKILIFSGYDEQLYALRYLQRGVNGYLGKNASEPELKKAMLSIRDNERYMSAAIKKYLLTETADPEDVQNPLNELSNREMEVMQAIMDGLNHAEISTRLNLQASTVSTYKQRIFTKLKVSNIVEMVEKFKLCNVDFVKSK
jgi:two-component system invasion response regulator UvrY